MSNPIFWREYYALKKEYFKNYELLEEMLSNKVKAEGLDFFIESGNLHELGRYEATLKYLCEACRVGNKEEENAFLLYFTYVHLRDMENAKRIKKSFCQLWANGVDDFNPSENVIRGKIIEARYDKASEDLALFLLEDLGTVEVFLLKHFGANFPKRIFVNLVNDEGPSPFNDYLSEMFIKIKKFNKTNKSRKEFEGTIVHEVTHFINAYFFERNFDFGKLKDLDSFRFLDEAFAMWKKSIYIGDQESKRIYADNCSYNVLKSGLVELFDLKNSWRDLISKRKFSIYSCAFSFINFILDKFGFEKTDKLFEQCENAGEIDMWESYVSDYFGEKLEKLMKDWKEDLFENSGNKGGKTKEIIKAVNTENSLDGLIVNYLSDQRLRLNQNIWLYDNNKRIFAEELESGKFKIQDNSITNVKLFAYLNEFEQVIDIIHQ